MGTCRCVAPLLGDGVTVCEARFTLSGPSAVSPLFEASQLAVPFNLTVPTGLGETWVQADLLVGQEAAGAVDVTLGELPGGVNTSASGKLARVAEG